MKRFSKILAIVLTACFLFGMIVTAAFAEEASSGTDPLVDDGGAYALISGEKYYDSALAVAAIKENVKNGDKIETGIDLTGIVLPEGIKGFEIVCPEDVTCTVSSANVTVEKTETGYDIYRTYVYTEDHRYSSGNDKSFGVVGSGSADDFASLESVTYNNNAYTQYAFIKVPSLNLTAKVDGVSTKVNGKYRYDFMLGEYNSKDLTVGYHASDYSYFTVDFDVFADKYIYTDADGNEVLSDTIPEGVTEYKLSYADGMYFLFDTRSIASASAKEYGGAYPITVKFNYIDGDWYATNTINDTKCLLSRNPYEVNHFTFAFKVNFENDSYKNVEMRYYFNGEYIAKKSYGAGYDLTIRAIDWYNSDAANNDMTKLSQKFSVGIDNFAANYYSKAYTSGESMNGIDDLFTAAEGTTTLVDHEGIVYDAEYPLDPSVNGYVQVNDGEKVCNHILAKRAIDEAERDSVVTVTRTVTSLLPKVPLTLSVSNKALVTFDDSVLDSFFIEEASSGDATTYTVREPNDSDAITLTWLDSFGNAVKTEKLLPGTKPTASDKNVTLYDPETGIGKIIAEWIWDLDGEGSDYESSAISTYNIRDIGKLRGRSVTVEPSLAELTGAAYIAYFKDGDVYRLADLTSNNFKNVNNIEKTVTICPNGTVIKLVFEGDRITLKHNAYYKYENKKITFDLNGKTITRYNTDGFGSALIRIGEGASAIVTSSAPGGRVFLASNRKDTTEGRPNNRIYGSDGLVHTEIGVDSAYIEISDIEFNGGTMVKFCGALTSDDAPSFENDTPIVCNVDNVVAYSPNRASYSVFASLCPDVELNIEDSKFYVTDSNYGIFHDYPASSSTYYHSEMQVKMKNCEVLSYTEGDAPVMCKLWVSMGLNSHMEVEHTKIIANLGGLSAARVKWGAGVEIATDSTKYFDASKVNEGVSYIINDGSLTNELQLSFTRAAFTTAWSYIDTSATPYKYLDTCYTNTETITRSATVTFITYADEDDSQFVGAVDWKDLAGNIVARSYGIVGTRLTAPVDPADYGYHNENTAWYTINYRWLPTTVKKGVTNSILRRGTGVSIRNKQANMSLTTGMVFNLYIPAPDKNIVQDSVYSPQSTGDIEFVTVNGTSMLKIQYSSALDDFAAQSVRIYFSTVSGIRLSYPVNIDPMKYVTALAKEYTCGSEEARLAYQIVAYKKAVAAYLAEAEGKTIDTYLDATELSAISSFESVFAAHTDCKCNSDLYDPESAGGESMDYEAYDAVGISGFAYLLDTESNGLRIDVNEGTAVKSVTYTDSAGIKMIHDESLNNLKLIVTDSARYYAVHGIRASDIAATIAITMSDGSTVTYSLAQYINSTDAAIGKALYSYSSAASAYKNK